MSILGTAQIHKRLDMAFDDSGLSAFCLDYFPQIYDSFTQGMRKHDKITLLLDYCRRQPGYFEVLLENVRNEYALRTTSDEMNSLQGAELKPLIDALSVYINLSQHTSKETPQSTAQIRKRLDIAFDDPELTAFCLEYLPEIYDRFSQGMHKHEKITLLLDYCRREPNGFEMLLNVVIQKHKRSNFQREELSPLIEALEAYLNPSQWAFQETPQSTAQIRKRLDIAFDAPELTAFCLEYLPEIYDRFSQGMHKDEKITLLLDYCRRRPNGFETLLENVRKEYQMSNFRREELLPLIGALEADMSPSVSIDKSSFTYNLRKIRKLLDTCFDDIQIESLIFDYFYEIFLKINRGTRKDTKINLLLSHCQKSPTGLNRLLEIVRNKEPEVFTYFERDIYVLDQPNHLNRDHPPLAEDQIDDYFAVIDSVWFLTVSSSVRTAAYIGESVELTFRLSPDYSPDSIPLELGEGEVCFFIEAEKLRLKEEADMVAFMLSTTSREPLEATVELWAQFAGIGRITIEPFYNGERLPALEPLKVSIRLEQDDVKKHQLPDPLGRRRVRHADLCLRVYTLPLDEEGSCLRLEYVLYSPHYSFHLPGTPMGTVEVTTRELLRLRARLDRLLRRGSLSAKRLAEGWRAIGEALYDLLFPSGLKEEYEKLRGKVTSWLLLCDAEPWIPWELVVPHGEGWNDGFLAARYSLGRWIEGWGVLRQAEFPMGAIHFAPDAALKDEHSSQEWTKLVAAGDLSRLEKSLLVEFPGGYPAALRASSRVWGLHFTSYPAWLQRRGGQLAVQEAVHLSSEKVKDYRLNLRQKEPLVTFGMLTPNRQSGLTEIERVWMPTFIQSGASAFVGPLWATSVESDRLFWQALYQTIWQERLSLGEALFKARQSLREASPDSLDWLAYFLVGDPMAKGYIPRPGDGYVSLECLNHDLAQALRLGQTASFVATLRTTPPPWYTGRLYEPPDEAWDNPGLFVFAPEFEILPQTSLPLERNNDIHTARFEMKPQIVGECDIFVNFLSDDEVRQSLTMKVTVKGGEGEE